MYIPAMMLRIEKHMRWAAECTFVACSATWSLESIRRQQQWSWPTFRGQSFQHLRGRKRQPECSFPRSTIVQCWRWSTERVLNYWNGGKMCLDIDCKSVGGLRFEALECLPRDRCVTEFGVGVENTHTHTHTHTEEFTTCCRALSGWKLT